MRERSLALGETTRASPSRASSRVRFMPLAVEPFPPFACRGPWIPFHRGPHADFVRVGWHHLLQLPSREDGTQGQGLGPFPKLPPFPLEVPDLLPGQVEVRLQLVDTVTEGLFLLALMPPLPADSLLPIIPVHGFQIT